MMKRKPLWIGLAVAAIVILAAANLIRDLERPVTIQAETVARRDLESVVTASGWLRPRRQVDVSANTIGKVVEVLVREGDQVELGETLLRIDPSRYRGEVEQLRAALRGALADRNAAEASFAGARDAQEREETLLARGLSSRDRHEQARRAVTRAEAGLTAANEKVRRQEAALQVAQHDLDQVTIVAEMSGVVTRLNVDEGENVITGTMNNPGTVLLAIADLSEMEVSLEVDETDIVHLQNGQTAVVRVDAFPDSLFGGEVAEIGHTPVRSARRARESSADFEVVVRLERATRGMRPGLSASADILTAVRESVPSVSIGALVYQDGYGLFVIESGRAVFTPVSTGITGERHVEILDGVGEGQQVVSGPFSALRELGSGARVRITRGAGEP